MKECGRCKRNLDEREEILSIVGLLLGSIHSSHGLVGEGVAESAEHLLLCALVRLDYSDEESRRDVESQNSVDEGSHYFQVHEENEQLAEGKEASAC